MREGAGRLYVDVMPSRAGGRYFGAAVQDVWVGAIDVVWKGRYEVAVYVHAARLHMALRLVATPATRLVSAVRAPIPDRI